MYTRATPFIEFHFPIVSIDEERGVDGRGGTCKAGMIMELDLMQSDRFMDLRFTVRDFNTLTPEEYPQEVMKYEEQLRQQNVATDWHLPPLHFEWQGRQYMLTQHENVEETQELLFRPKIQVTRFKTVDLEVAGESVTACEIQLQEETTEGWALFYAQCDRLTGKGYGSTMATAGLSALQGRGENPTCSSS